MIKRLSSKLFLLVISFFISLFIAEGLFRVFSNITKVYYPATWISPAIYIETKEGYSLLPNQKAIQYSLYKNYIAHYTTNSQGIRSRREYLTVKPKNTKRIFIVGDSLVFGVGVNDHETLASVLEEKLNRRSQDGTHYEVFNLGVIGYTFDNCYVRLKKYLEFKPDLIVYVVLGVNDFLDILDHEWVLASNQEIIAVKENSRHIDKYNRFVNGPKSLYKEDSLIIGNIREFLRKNSVMYAFLGTLRYRNRLKSKETEARRENIELETKGVGRSIQVLNRLFDSAYKDKFKIIFILEGFNNGYIKKDFLNYLTQKTNLIIDADDFNRVDGLYIPRDGHWTVFGNDYIAGIVVEYLRDKQLL